jgi:CheY-like chemotaxis protein
MDMYTLDRPFKILLVEDNPGDVRLTIEALKEEGVYNELHVVRDGVEALEFLYGQGQYREAVRPDLILLDLNLPKKDGREVLAEIKADADLGCIPVVVLSTSDSAEDILKAYQLHANCYVTKPVELDEFFAAVQSIAKFWFRIVQMPPRL